MVTGIMLTKQRQQDPPVLQDVDSKDLVNMDSGQGVAALEGSAAGLQRTVGAAKDPGA